jgi:GntP family gluconate:H+ symporter
MEGIAVIPWWAAIIGLAIAIVLIVKKFNPTYSLFIGAAVGCIIGGESLANTVTVLVNGTSSIMGTAIRVLAAGFLAGVMMESGAAESIAHAIVTKLGERMALFSLALSTMIICAVGVFIPVAVLIVAPIALSVGKQTGITKLALLVALSGGGKAGNIMSPNPNTVSAAGGFNVPLSSVMLASIIPAVFGLGMATLMAMLANHHGSEVLDSDTEGYDANKQLMPLGRALIAPVLAIVLLMLSPIGQLIHFTWLANLNLDAMYVLPVASIIATIAMGHWRNIIKYCTAGLGRVTDTVLILIGAGALAGLITASDLAKQIQWLISSSGVSGTLLAPIVAILMGLAVGSTSTAVILTTGSFGTAILATGTTPLAAAVMTNAGGTVIDAVPQGNYFQITAQSMHMSIGERAKVMPYEIAVGLTTTIIATVLFGFLRIWS